MRWDEYVEEATARIRNRAMARNVRRELRDHLESATEALVEEGMDRSGAETEAMRRLGPVGMLAEQFRLRYRPSAPVWPVPVTALGFAAAVTALGSHDPAAGILLMFWCLVWAALHPISFLSMGRVPLGTVTLGELRARWLPVRPFAIAGAIAGTLLALQPVVLAANPSLDILVLLCLAGGSWYVAVRRLPPGQEDLAFPFGSGLAAVVLFLSALLISVIFRFEDAGMLLVGAFAYFLGADWLGRFDVYLRKRALAREEVLLVGGFGGMVGPFSDAPGLRYEETNDRTPAVTPSSPESGEGPVAPGV